MTSLDPLSLNTPRLHLRPPHRDDAAALFHLFSDPEVTRYWSTLPWTSIDQATALIERDLAAIAAGDAIRFAIEHEGALIGQCTLFALSAQSRRAEIGYALARAAWGHGYMHEALTALLAHGFGPMNLNRVEADIDPRNTASARSLQRLGFQSEGLLRERWIVGGDRSDSQMFGLLRRDYEQPDG